VSNREPSMIFMAWLKHKYQESQ